MLTLLDRLIGRSVLFGTLLVLGVFAALFVFIVLVDALGDYGKGSFGLWELLRYVMLSQPRKLYETFPITVLIGTLLGLSTLAVNSELIAMRAAGVSKVRIVGAAMKTGVVLIVAAVLVGEYVVPQAETRAQSGRAQALQLSFKQGNTGLWLRDGSHFVNIGEVLPDLSLLRVNIYDVSTTFEIERQTVAARAVYDNQRWRLEQVRTSRIGGERIETDSRDAIVWDAGFTPDVVAVFTTRPEALSIAQLHAYIRHLQSNNQDVRRYVLAFWQKCFMPLATALMIVLAAPFVFRSVRSGGMAQRIFVGVALGLAFVVINRSMGYLAVIYGTPPLAAAIMPLVIFLSIAIVMMRRAD